MTTRPRARRRRSLAGRDAIDVLRTDHRRIRSLLVALQHARTQARRAALIDQAAEVLKRHTALEEDVFYPAFREAAKTKRDRTLFHGAREEHHIVDLVLPEVRAARHEPDVFAARVRVLRELIDHHIAEEQDVMFPRARQLLSESQLHALGTELGTRARVQPAPGGAFHAVGALIGLAP